MKKNLRASVWENWQPLPLRLRASVPPCREPSVRLGVSKFPTPLLRVILPMLAAILLLSSCIEPSPLYGTWADNRGNTFSFFDDNTFIAKITRAGQPAENYDGNYTVLVNALTLDCTNIELRIVTEWDIRGNILYLNWTSAEGDAMSLSLFKISN